MKQAKALPSVLTKYSSPTLRPTFPECFTRCAVRRGMVAPINSVGTNTSRNVNSVVSGALIWRVNWPTAWNKPSEKLPKTPIAISIAPNTPSSGRRSRDSRPPAKLPRPSPSMKAVTTTVTLSTLMP